MIFSLDVRRARKGDCLLLHSGTEADPGLVLIDGGPTGVYKPQLKPRIRTIRAKRGLTDEDSLIVDALMVSHIDDDHIHGIIDLGKEEVGKKRDHKPQAVNVLSLWHNSFDAVIADNTAPITAAMGEQFGTAAVSKGSRLAESKKDKVVAESTEPPEVVESGLMVLASIEQGFRLRQIADFLGWPRNPDFDGKLVMVPKTAKVISVASGLTFTVVGPMRDEVDALRKKHLAWLKALKKKGKSPPEALAAYVDQSVPNLSSLVVMAEAEGKRILLTGDARGDRIIAGLQASGLLGSGKKSKTKVDILKVPHHGSANNLEEDFFRRIVADHYVFSGDGEYGNPERETMQMLFDARGSDPFTIHLTYPIDEIDVLRKADWETQQAKEKKKPKGKVRPNWSAKTNSLTAFFAKRKSAMKAAGQTIAIVPETGAHVIDLKDPLGY